MRFDQNKVFEEDVVFARQRQIPWWDQARVARTRVAVVGVGGIGCHVALEAARLGVGEIWLCDRDVVEPSNLNRQVLFRPVDVGRAKVRAAAEALEHAHLISPTTRVTKEHYDLLDEWHRTLAVVRSASFVFNGFDLPEVKRVALAAACLHYQKPMIYAGTDTISGAAGMILLQLPAPAAPCYECLQAVESQVPAGARPLFRPERVVALSSLDLGRVHAGPGDEGGLPPAATNVTAAASVTSVAMALMLQVVHGHTSHLPHRVILDLVNFEMHAYRLGRRPGCMVCGGPADEEGHFTKEGV